MELVRSAILVLRFLLELCALAGLAYWGATARLQRAGRILLAIAVPLVAAVVWALIVAPRAPVQVAPAIRFGVELLVFAAAGAALLARQRLVLTVIFAVLYIVNRSLMAVWHQ